MIHFRRLRHELKLAGARDDELAHLLALAENLHNQAPKLPAAHVPEAISSRFRRHWLPPLGVASVAGIAIGMVLPAYAAAAVPGSWLYPVQKLTDTIAISYDPSYRGVVMMKRADYVRHLVATRADSRSILSAVADYQAVTVNYKADAAHYAVFEFCKQNLRQAADAAPPVAHSAILHALAALQT